MALTFEISYEEHVVRQDMPALPKAVRGRIRAAIGDKLTSHPDTFGKPLRRSLKGYRKLRVGEYRVVFRIHRQKVLIFAILHRSVVYGEAERRLFPR